jgi:flagellar motor switch protein FliN
VSLEERPTPVESSLAELGPADPSGPPSTLAALLDVPMPIVIEIGRTRMTVEELLKLSVGSVIELDRMIEEPVDIFVADRRLAQGQVVVVGEHFAVRVTRVMSGTGSGKEA